jgi:hypothetical protein
MIGTFVFVAVAVAVSDQRSPGLLAFGLVMALIYGGLSSLLPAFIADLLAAALHRTGEPPWRSALVGVSAGALAAEIFPLLAVTTLGFDRVDAAMDSSQGSKGLLLLSLCAGLLAGLCSGLTQWWETGSRVGPTI